MTGAEHYRRAEELLAEAADVPHGIFHVDREDTTPGQLEDLKRRFSEIVGKKVIVTAQPVMIDVSGTLVAAQVHATLALAAATTGIFHGDLS